MTTFHAHTPGEAPLRSRFPATQLGIVCFRFLSGTGSRGADLDLNSINQALLERLQLGGDAFVSSTSLNGVFWLRACILNPGTSTQDLHALLDALRRAAAQMQ